MNYLKKYTVITGASSGIGYAAAQAFAERGKNLILVARRVEVLKALKNKLNLDCPNIDIVIKGCDLAIAENVYQLYAELAGFQIETWINNAGVGYYGDVETQPLSKIEALLRVNIDALTILSTLYTRDHHDTQGAQLINISSAGGYTLVPEAVSYCASKFYVSAFTEGLAHELKAKRAKLKAKVLAPAATKTAFGMVANGVTEYDYDKAFRHYHTREQMAAFLLALYDSDKTVGIVSRETFEFVLTDFLFSNAYGVDVNQHKENV